MAKSLDEVDDFEEGDDKAVLESHDNDDLVQQDLTDIGQDGYINQDNFETDDETTNTDVLAQFLSAKGVDPKAVKIQDDKGETQSVDFNTLSPEEQLQILNYNDSDDNYGLDDDEISLINQLRSNNLSVDDYNNYVSQQAINNYLKSNQAEQLYQVDAIPDDELYLIDLKARVPDLSDEDALSRLDTAKSNADVYSKEIESIREDYKQKENQIIEQDQLEQQEKINQQTKEFEDVIVNTIQNNDSIDLGESQLFLSDDDKNEVASFILDSDVTGTRFIAKALNDPNTLVKMAWYALKGEDAFAQVQDYYKQKLSEVAKYNYNKGYQDSKSGKASNSAKSIVRKPTATRGGKTLTINDIE